MRVQNIQIGETYQVKVPQRLPPALRHRIPRTHADFAADMRLNLRRGDRFDLTVTGTDPEGATVDGYEATTTNRVTLRLTADQIDAVKLDAVYLYADLGDEEVVRVGAGPRAPVRR
ncbi:hypothetical protein ACFU8Q_33475 [Streptomyces sp. NPDC057543]|uniref:hypothetical protein n=1 Tax=Streptomyces sp. NPDC057543 TaxID=3346163 RepID=UPI0036D1161E